jgi:hypothetical protein
MFHFIDTQIDALHFHYFVQTVFLAPYTKQFQTPHPIATLLPGAQARRPRTVHDGPAMYARRIWGALRRSSIMSVLERFEPSDYCCKGKG